MEHYLDENGNLTVIDKGYAEIRWLYSGNSLIAFSYYDEKGKPTNNMQGFASVKRTLDNNKNIIVEQYLGADGNPIMTSYGYCEVRCTYKDGQKLIEEYYDTDGKLVRQEKYQ